MRRWRRGGRTVHHIVDPSHRRAGRAGLAHASASTAASCVDANTASTAAIVRGADAPAWLESLGLPARLVDPDGRRRARRRLAEGRGMIVAAAPSPLWYLSRGTGAVTLVLLTATVVLGIAGTLRWRPAAGLPRFLVDGLHRNLSLLVVVLLAAHVLTAVLDPFAHLRAIDAVVPLASAYRPLWLGLGALALDLLIALVVTSLVRARLGLRAWRAVHWVAYACWPVALLHGLGTGTDASAPWLQALAALCVGRRRRGRRDAARALAGA